MVARESSPDARLLKIPAESSAAEFPVETPDEASS
jgi:hypothetical protein